MKPFRTKDSTLAYYINQLENLDPKLHLPLVSISWSRDMKLRPGITMAQESTSFTQSTFAGPSTLGIPATANGGNMPWVSAETSDIPGVLIDGQKLVKPLRLLAREISYTSVELERSAILQTPIDSTQLDAFNSLYQMNTDQMVYIGSADVGAQGLLNNSLVTATSVATGAASGTQWMPSSGYAGKTPNEILTDVNTLLTATWAASGYAVCPAELRLPPAQFGYISATLVSTAGSVSILKFLQDNSIALSVNGKPLNIQPIKWLPGRGASAADRMLAYTNELDRVRFPMVPARRETPYYKGIRFTAPYIWMFGEVEMPYPETLMYADGI